jgi:hypothetical protein
VQDRYGIGRFNDGFLEYVDTGQLLNRGFELATRVGESVAVGNGSELFRHGISGRCGAWIRERGPTTKFPVRELPITGAAGERLSLWEDSQWCVHQRQNGE